MGAAPSSPSAQADSLLAARVQHEQAEAERVRALTVEDVKRVRAAALREEAEAERVRALTVEDVKRVRAAALREEAEADRARKDALQAQIVRQASAAVLTATVTALAIDWLVHAYTPFIRWRVKRQLQAGTLLKRAVVRVPVHLLPSLPVQLPGAFLPTLLYGPSGCGKSLFLSQLARQMAARHVPVALVRFRVPQDEETSGKKESGEEYDTQLMQTVANDVCVQVGYPTRDAVPIMLLHSLRSLRLSSPVLELELRVQARQASRRAQAALTTLFEAARELRHANLMDADMAPVLLFDEVHDLMRDDRLRNHGGRAVFKMLAGFLVSIGTDEGVARIIVAGSSFNFALELYSVSAATRSRTSALLLPDPDAGAVVTALVANGYTEAQARAMVSLCGPRLRLLETPLQKGPSAFGGVFETFVSQCRSSTAATLRSCFAAMSTAAEVQRFADLLDRIEAANAGTARRPNLLELPEYVNKPPPPTVVFADDAMDLHFQSELVRTLWSEMRLLLSALRGKDPSAA